MDARQREPSTRRCGDCISPMTDESALYLWNDPDDLLRSLAALSSEDRGSLRDAVAKLLAHSDPDVREEAFRAVFVKWKERKLRELALTAIAADVAPEVRAVAAFAVAATSDDDSRRTDTRTLIAKLEDPDELPLVKAAVYDALLILHRRSTFPSKASTFDSNVDIDWNWVFDLKRD